MAVNTVVHVAVIALSAEEGRTVEMVQFACVWPCMNVNTFRVPMVGLAAV